MGQAYCCGSQTGGEPELGLLYPATTLNGKTYTVRQMWIIVKLQSTFRMWLARKKLQQLRYEFYSPGGDRHYGQDDYNNINVEVSVHPFDRDFLSYQVYSFC